MSWPSVGGCSSSRTPARAIGRPSLLAVTTLLGELGEPRVADPQVVADLVEERLLDHHGEVLGAAAVGLERAAEERDLARIGRVFRAIRRPRNALINAE